MVYQSSIKHIEYFVDWKNDGYNIKNFADKTINIHRWVNFTNTPVPLDSLTWDGTGLTWLDEGSLSIGGGGIAPLNIGIPEGTNACLIRYNVSWADTGEEFAHVIAEAIVNDDGGWEIQQTLINFDVHNNQSVAANDFELELYGITPEDIFDYYDGWGTPPEMNYYEWGTELIWKGDAIYPCEWIHFGLEISPSINEVTLSNVVYNWTYHCDVGSYRIWYRVWYNGTWGQWYHGNWNESVVFNLSSIGENESCRHIIEYYVEDDLGNAEYTYDKHTWENDGNDTYYIKPGYRYGPDRKPGTADDDTYIVNQLYGPNGTDDNPAGWAGGDDPWGPDGAPGKAGVDDDGDSVDSDGDNYCDGSGSCIVCQTMYESDCNGVVDGTELLNIISDWYMSNLSMSELLQGIKYWKAGFIV